MPWFSSSPSIILLSVAWSSLLPHLSFLSPPHPQGSAPGIDLDNRVLSCVCLINSSAGCIQDAGVDLSQDGNSQEAGRECGVQAGLTAQGPALPSSHLAHWGPGGPLPAPL